MRPAPLLALALAGCPASAPRTDTGDTEKEGRFALEQPKPTTPPGMLACMTRELSSEVSGWPTGMILADLNRDGSLDAAVEVGARGKGGVESHVSIQLNDGRGQFTESSTARLAQFSYALGAADLDGDGSLELFTNDYRGRRVALFATTGNGDVRGPMLVKTRFRPGGINPHDTDGDGDLDLVVSSLRHVEILENRGGLKFAAAPAIAINQAPDEVVSVDLDGDGRRELAVVANDSSKLYSLRVKAGNRLAIASVSPTCRSPSTTQSGDLDGDGRDDLAFHCSGAVAIRLAARRRLITIPSPHVEAMGLGDVDGDGDIDIVTAGRKCATCGSDVRFYANDGRGALSERSAMHVDGHVKSPTIADLDGDGSPDLAVAVWPGRPPGRLSVYLGGACR